MTVLLMTEDGGPRTRRADPLTSHAAAESNTNRADVVAFVLGLFQEFGPMCDEELTTSYFLRQGPDCHIDSPRKRRSDLTDAGLIEATNIVRLSRSNRKMTVWALK